MDAEEKLRREAVRRSLAGESAAVIARELRRSRRWVVKWLAREQGHQSSCIAFTRSIA